MLTAEQQQAYDALYQYAHSQMMAGVPDEKIHAEMIEQGWDFDVARTITANLRAQQQQQPAQLLKPNYYTPNAYVQQQRPRARRTGGAGGGGDMALGAIICIIGLVVTIGSYTAASSGGGSYVIAWGAIVFGAIRFFKGLAASGSPD